MNIIDLLNQKIEMIFGIQSKEIDQRYKEFQKFDPNNQRLALKETLFSLFPSQKEDASLRIYKQEINDDNKVMKRRHEVIVSITQEYQAHLFNLSPSLHKCFIDYKRYNKDDFWCHVVCAAFADVDDKKKKEKMDEHKDISNLIKDLMLQIQFKNSPLQKILKDILQIRDQHKDLVQAYAAHSTYGQTYSDCAATNLYQTQFVHQTPSIPSLSFVVECAPIPQTGFSGVPYNESHFYQSDQAFHLIRQINCFSSNVHQIESKLSDPQPLRSVLINTVRCQQLKKEVTTVQKPPIIFDKLETLAKTQHSTQGNVKLYADSQQHDELFDVKVIKDKKSDAEALQRFERYRDFYSVLMFFSVNLFEFARKVDYIQEDSIGSSQSAITRQIGHIKYEQKHSTNAATMQECHHWLDDFNEAVRDKQIDVRGQLSALFNNGSNLKDLYNKCVKLVQALEIHVSEYK